LILALFVICSYLLCYIHLPPRGRNRIFSFGELENNTVHIREKEIKFKLKLKERSIKNLNDDFHP
jgi:hypothetical protein